MTRELFDYQQKGLAFIQENKVAGLFVDMGLGKTATTLCALADLPGPTLLVGPIRVIETVWHREAEQWEETKNLTFSLVRGSVAQRTKALKTKANIYLTNPEMLAEVMTHPDRPNFRILVIDESSMFKNPSTKRFKLLRRHLKDFERRIILTGTPTPNSLMDIWSQIFILDQGKRLDTSFGRFQRRYFYPTDYQGYKWEAFDWAPADVLGKCKDILFRVSYEDASKKRIKPFDNPIPVVLPPAVMRQYKQMEAEAFLAISKTETLTAPMAATKLMKLRQMASGFVYNDQEEITQVHKAKIEALAEIVEAQAGRPLIVVYQFNHELAALQKAFPQGWKFESDLQDAWDAGELPILFLHPQSGGHGLNLQHGGSTMVIFSGTFSYEQISQTKARIDRTGQERQPVFHYLVAQDTVDEMLMEVIEGKAKNQKSVLAMIKEYANEYAKTNRSRGAGRRR